MHNLFTEYILGWVAVCAFIRCLKEQNISGFLCSTGMPKFRHSVLPVTEALTVSPDLVLPFSRVIHQDPFSDCEPFSRRWEIIGLVSNLFSGYHQEPRT